MARLDWLITAVCGGLVGVALLARRWDRQHREAT